MKKNRILLVSGIADTFFSPNSKRKLEFGSELADKIEKVVSTSNLYSGYINLTIPTDHNKDIYAFKNVERQQKVINVVLNSDHLLDIVNEITLLEHGGSKKLLNGDSLDFVIPPKDYEIHLCGIDINGVYKNFINELLALGYTVYLYSDLLKRYKDTESFIKTVKNNNFKYCSHKSVK